MGRQILRAVCYLAGRHAATVIRSLFALAFCLPSAVSRADEPSTQPSDEIAITECLVIKPVGRYGRAAVHLDAVEAQIVAGKWTAPKAGDIVTLPDGSSQKWAEAKAGDDGRIAHEALNGGYACATIVVDSPRVMILDATGYNTVYVNAEPRMGDPYEAGYVLTPVALRAGPNELLFHCGRGSLRAKLVAPKAAAMLNTRDPTLPDLVVRESGHKLGAVVVLNAAAQSPAHLAIRAWFNRDDSVVSPVPAILPVGSRKVGFEIPPPPAAAEPGTLSLNLELVRDEGGLSKVLDTGAVSLRLRKPEETQRRTFRSGLDGSVQYYALNPARPLEKDTAAPALFLTLHGASVEAVGQAEAYAAKTWGHIVAPTNRRPYGFDWEDWGRLDALEVLDLTAKELKTDPLRTYLTGHSMGGHGTWQIGVTFPDRFAAIAPSAGWISFWSYAGARRPANATPVERMLARASLPSDTLKLLRNYKHYGVYILHGEKDDNVPVEQARTMVKRLAKFHRDFAYFEQPGAGHWWGGACVDWPPLFDFLKQHTRPATKDVRRVEFSTACPGVSARCDWADIEAQIHPLELSSIDIRFDPEKASFVGQTTNVARLSLDLGALKPAKEDATVTIELDEQKKIENLPWPKGEGRLWLARDGESWSVQAKPSLALKGPHRYGLFKDAFRNHVLLVYGTKGTPEEIAWALAKVRYDTEMLWYRGNASIDVLADEDFDASKAGERNIVLYGNADTNAAWKPLLGSGPVQVRRGEVAVGSRKLAGDDLACLFIRPLPGSDTASVGVVSGSGLAGLRLTDRVPYFVSGVSYPDYVIMGPEMLTKGGQGLRAAGFFTNDWSVEAGDSAWTEDAASTKSSKEDE